MKLRTSIYVFLILAIAYVAMALFGPIDPVAVEKYDLSETKLRLLNFTIIVPVLAIWSMAFYGFMRFKKYAEMVSGSKEGPAYNLLATGLMVLALTLPVNSVIAAALKIITIDNPNLIPTAEIVKNYVGLVLAFVSFYLIAQSARQLTQTFKVQQKLSKFQNDAATIGLITFSCFYTWLVLYRPAVGGSKESVYFLPSWLILITLIIPYIFAWRVGVQGAFDLYKYQKHLKGYVYKSAFRFLAWGVGSVVVLSILLQGLVTISEQLNRLNLTPLLLIIYGLLILYAVGFGLVAKGAQKLKQIEEV